MSINHYDLSHPPPQWWSPHHRNPAPIDLNYDDEHQQQELVVIPKDRLFEKPLTPSDVGKLNRLVIPKQHAEKHFPLNGGGGGGENGLLLGFEDEIGKPWRFRYSYWNSSQSYVLTKGWSRYVKDKRLHAGDVVVFARHRLDPARFFIGCRRRAAAAIPNQHQQYPYHHHHHHHAGPGPSTSSLPYQPESIHAAAGTVVQEKRKTTGRSSSKWLRLFGVNLECQQAADESDSPESSPATHHHQYY